jgi:hypothetical protein
MSRNPKLRKIIKSYVSAAIKLLSKETGSKFPSDNWSDAPEIPFIFSEDKLKHLPEYQKCLIALENDSIIASQLNAMVGIESRRSRSRKAVELVIRLPHLAIYQNKVEFNEEYFKREYEAFESTIYDNFFVYEVVVPLSGPVFPAPIKLSNELEICRVNPNDLSLPLQSENLSNRIPHFNKLLWAIRTQYSLFKVIGDKEIELDETERNEERRNKVNEAVEQVLTCLRLLNVSNVYPLTILHRTKSWLFHDVRQYPLKYFPSNQFSLQLDEDFHKTFPKFWKEFQQQAVNKHKFIGLAAKRFSYAHERHDWEDRIIDLLIAAEAIFLSQAGNQGELKHRLKLHAAKFLATDSKIRKQIFEDMSLAYDLRSNIVHGSNALDGVLKKIRKKESDTLSEKEKIDQFTYRIQDYIRVGINKTIDFASRNSQQQPVDWDDLLLN